MEGWGGHLCMSPPPFVVVNIVVRIRWFGHPRLYATLRDESLNSLLANLAEAVHPANFESGIFVRIDIQAQQGSGVHKHII